MSMCDLSPSYKNGYKHALEQIKLNNGLPTFNSIHTQNLINSGYITPIYRNPNNIDIDSNKLLLLTEDL